MSAKEREQPIDAARIEQIRRQSHDTRTMVREVAGYLFLECGIYPSANKVYGLIQQGSISTVADELNQFWSQLKHRISARMDIPALPTSVQERLAAFGVELWEQASGEAKDNYEQERRKLEAQTLGAQERERSAREALHALQGKMDARIEDYERVLATQQSEIKRSEHMVVEARSQAQTLRDELARRAAEHHSLEKQLASAQADFARELTAQREQVKAAEARSEAVNKRALLEIDLARTEAKAAVADADKRADTAANKAEAVQRENAKLNERTIELTRLLAQTEAQLSAARREADQAESLRQQLEALRAQLEAASLREIELVRTTTKLSSTVVEQSTQIESLSAALTAEKARADTAGESIANASNQNHGA